MYIHVMIIVFSKRLIHPKSFPFFHVLRPSTLPTKEVIMTSQTVTPTVSVTPHLRRSTVKRNFFIAVASWLVATVVLAVLNLTDDLPTRLLPLPVVLGITLPLLVYARSSAFRHFIQTTNIRNLTLFNVWRVPAAFAFFYYISQDLLPTPSCETLLGVI